MFLPIKRREQMCVLPEVITSLLWPTAGSVCSPGWLHHNISLDHLRGTTGFSSWRGTILMCFITWCYLETQTSLGCYFAFILPLPDCTVRQQGMLSCLLSWSHCTSMFTSRVEKNFMKGLVWFGVFCCFLVFFPPLAFVYLSKLKHFEEMVWFWQFFFTAQEALGSVSTKARFLKALGIALLVGKRAKTSASEP